MTESLVLDYPALRCLRTCRSSSTNISPNPRCPNKSSKKMEELPGWLQGKSMRMVVVPQEFGMRPFRRPARVPLAAPPGGLRRGSNAVMSSGHTCGIRKSRRFTS